MASWVLQDCAQVGHHGSRQLAATEIQRGQCGALPEHAHQVLKGFLEAGLLHPGRGVISGAAVAHLPPSPNSPGSRASPEFLHPALGPGQALAQHTQAPLAEPILEQAQLSQAGGRPEGLREVEADRVRQFAVGQPVVKKHMGLPAGTSATSLYPNCANCPLPGGHDHMCTPLLCELYNKPMHASLNMSNCAERPVKLRWATSHSVT